MELFLQAIESSEGSQESLKEVKTEGRNPPLDGSPSLSFEQRPPQWCIVEKWFLMTIVCYDESIKELEAIVYNSEGDAVKYLQPEEKLTNDKDGKRAIVTVNQSTHKATFKVRFINGSKGAWLHIGLHNLNQPEKCLLKSPPIKVQTNRSKRPRDSKKKPIPIVNSLSPNTVPSTGSFPARKDRMLLIFGSNFHLWGNSPVVKFKFVQNDHYMEIRPPDLIWWSENLLECQLPECNQDVEVRVANYDLIYGEGKVLKITDSFTSDDNKEVAKLERPHDGLVDPEQITNSHLFVDYSPVDGMDEVGLELLVKVTLVVSNEFILAETANGRESINVQDVGVVLKLWNKTTSRLVREIFVTKEGQRFCRNPDSLVLTCKIQLERNLNPLEQFFVMVGLEERKHRAIPS